MPIFLRVREPRSCSIRSWLRSSSRRTRRQMPDTSWTDRYAPLTVGGCPWYSDSSLATQVPGEVQSRGVRQQVLSGFVPAGGTVRLATLGGGTATLNATTEVLL